MPTNTTAWINAKHAQLEVGPAPYTPPRDDQIVIRNHAVAVSPLDWIIQVGQPHLPGQSGDRPGRRQPQKPHPAATRRWPRPLGCLSSLAQGQGRPNAARRP
jgi:hypothetical protein